MEAYARSLKIRGLHRFQAAGDRRAMISLVPAGQVIRFWRSVLGDRSERAGSADDSDFRAEAGGCLFVGSENRGQPRISREGTDPTRFA
jgi:hypothetical protein